MTCKGIDSDEIAAVCARLQLPPEAEQLAAPDDGAIGGRDDNGIDGYERGLLTYSEWLRLATRRDLTAGG